MPHHQWSALAETDTLAARIRLQRAGHILGSAYLEIDLTYPATSDNTRIFSAPNAALLMPPRADILGLESTYGDHLHEDHADQYGLLKFVTGMRELPTDICGCMESKKPRMRWPKALMPHAPTSFEFKL